MAEDSKIEWTTHTFNPWRGCTKVSPGCANCYADAMSTRNPKVLGVWGPSGTRVVAAEAQWREPLKWNEMAREGVCPHCHGKSTRKTPGRCTVCDGTGRVAPYRPRVFCASLADVFEGPETMPPAAVPLVAAARRRLFKLIAATPNLDWLLLTKRPENVFKLTREAIDPDGEPGGNECCEPNGLEVYPFGELFPNVWLGTSVENQQAADERIPHLLRVPAAVRFLSCEPLLGPVAPLACMNSYWTGTGWSRTSSNRIEPIHWVIVGGESGPGARPMQIEWARSLVQQCKAAGVPVFVKQLGAKPAGDDLYQPTGRFRDCPETGKRQYELKLLVTDAKGGDIDEFPADLRVREFPEPKAGAA